MDLILHVIYVLARWRFPFLVFGLVAFPGIVALFCRQKPGQGRFGRVLRTSRWIIGAYALINVMLGPGISTRLVYWFGRTGQATITGSYATSTQYNHHDVVGYDVLLKTADGRMVETSFEDDDFNVYPPRNATTYPGEGDQFNVRYLGTFPQDFVIISDDDSPWALSLRCNALLARVGEAKAKYEFSPKTPGYRDAYVEAFRSVLTAHCKDMDEDAIRAAIEKAQSGEP